MDTPVVGQRVLLKAIGNNARFNARVVEGEVTSVRRALFSVQIDGSYRPTDVYIDSRYEKGDFPGWKVYLSKQEMADETEGEEITGSLIKIFRHSHKLTLDQLRRIKAIVDE